MKQLKRDHPKMYQDVRSENYNLQDVKVVLGQDCYKLHHAYETAFCSLENMPMVATSQLGVCLCGTIDPKYTSGSSSTVSIISAHEAPQASFDETYHDDDSNDVQNFANSFQQLKPTLIGRVGPRENYHRQVMPKKPLDIRGISDENRSQK